MGISRMQFLRGRFSEPDGAVRPPWSLAGSGFTDACSRCDDCIKACPTRILVRGKGGFPEVDFKRGECTFCGDCARACATSALDPAAHQRGDTPWTLVASIGAACLALNKVVCRTCGEACEPRALSFRLAPGGVSRPHLDAAACNGCGACVAICPVAAVSVVRQALAPVTVAA